MKLFCYIENLIEWQNSQKAYKKQTLVLITDSIPADESNQETENVLEVSKALSIRVHGGKILMGSFTDSVVRENDISGAKVVHQKVPQKVQQKVQEKVQPKIHEKVQRYQGDSGNLSIILCQYLNRGD